MPFQNCEQKRYVCQEVIIYLFSSESVQVLKQRMVRNDIVSLLISVFPVKWTNNNAVSSSLAAQSSKYFGH